MTESAQGASPSVRPILFSGPMIRALLDGKKSQTRRIMKPQPPKEQDFFGSSFGLERSVADGVKMYSLNDYVSLPKHPSKWDLVGSVGVARDAGYPMQYTCPYGRPGDLLWVRETWAGHKLAGGGSLSCYRYGYNGEHPPEWCGAGKWTPSIHMPRWASRLTLELIEVRVERLQNISETDARAEGCPITWDGKPYDPPPPEVDSWQGYGRYSYCLLWSQINGPGSWDANPWVWVLSFKVHRRNVDELLKREAA